MYCADCDKLLCSMCCRIHADIKEIANHTTMSKTELFKNFKSELHTKLNLLHQVKTEISTNAKGLESDISRIQGVQENLKKEVDKKIDNAMHQLNETHFQL